MDRFKSDFDAMKLKVNSIEKSFHLSKHQSLTNKSIITLFAENNSHNSILSEIKNIMHNHQLPFKLSGSLFLEI